MGHVSAPPIPRQFSGNKAIQLKYIDDSSKAASVNLKRSLTKDPVERPQPLNFHERFGTVLKPEENILQMELEKFHNWTLENKLLANTKKCFTMQFSRSRVFDFPLEFKLGNSEFLEEKKSMKILGLVVQSNLGWDSQINQMVGRANKTTWAIRRMKALGVDKQTLVEYWKAEGRVHLEFACPVWHSSINKAQRQSLERSQRVAMAAIVGFWEPSLTQQLQALSLERLEARRESISRRFATSTATRSRHSDIFSLGPEAPARKAKHSLKYREPRARTAAYRKSAVPYLTRLLNQ